MEGSAGEKLGSRVMAALPGDRQPSNLQLAEGHIDRTLPPG